MLWIDEVVLLRVGFVLQIAGVLAMLGCRSFRGEWKSMCETFFLVSLLMVGVLTAVSASRGTYEWPIMGITLGVMTVGSLLEATPRGELPSSI